MNDPFISIVVPVYNVEKYLHKCLDSFLSQTYKDFEVILVDDGSKDSSGQICDEYASKDNRFKVYHRENSGPGAARNFGIDQARGKYLSFVDSDDWIEDNYVETIMNEMHVDLLYFGMRGLREKKEPYNYIMPTIDQDGNVEDLLYSMLIRQNGYYDFVMVANKCFVKDIIKNNNIIFPVNILHSEDEIFTLRYFLCIRSFQCIDDVLYNYNQRNSSSSFHTTTDEYYRICKYQYELSERFHSSKIKTFIKTRCLFCFYNNYRFNKADSNIILSRLKSFFNENDITCLSIALKDQRNNPNFYPTPKFLLFTNDFCFFFKYKMLYFLTDFFIVVREHLYEVWMLLKYEWQDKVVSKLIMKK